MDFALTHSGEVDDTSIAADQRGHAASATTCRWYTSHGVPGAYEAPRQEKHRSPRDCAWRSVLAALEHHRPFRARVSNSVSDCSRRPWRSEAKAGAGAGGASRRGSLERKWAGNVGNE